MILEEEEIKRKEFCDILFELAKNQWFLKDEIAQHNIYNRLENLYYSSNKDKRYRHFYSDIFTVLTEIQQDADNGNINILGQNLEVIRQEYIPQNIDENGNLIDISDNLQKLYDHVNLDIARMTYSDAGDWKVSGEEIISEIQSQIKMVQKDVEKTYEAHKK